MLNTHDSPMTTVEIDSLLTQDDVRVLLETSEPAGTMRLRDLAEIVEATSSTRLEQDALLRELETRGIEIVEDAARGRDARAGPRALRRRRPSRRPTRCSSFCATPAGTSC